MSDIRRIAQKIDADLPVLAKKVIREHLDLAEEDDRAFLEQPDAREHHQTQWHQWGIITHTRTFLLHFDSDVPAYLRDWGVWEEVDFGLGGEVGGTPKWELLRITILLHDIGKFAARTKGKDRFHFRRHEQVSGQLITDSLGLEEYGLSPPQVQYVSRTAADHFVLGVLRKRARERGLYNAEFLHSPEFAESCLQIRTEHEDDYLEVGVLFLGDSMSKVDPRRGPEQAVTQHEMNIEVAKKYLRIVIGRSA